VIGYAGRHLSRRPGLAVAQLPALMFGGQGARVLVARARPFGRGPVRAVVGRPAVSAAQPVEAALPALSAARRLSIRKKYPA
jgi:hypothetical protein